MIRGDPRDSQSSKQQGLKRYYEQHQKDIPSYYRRNETLISDYRQVTGFSSHHTI